MATQRYISTSFWDDEWIQTLDPSEKFLYLYLLTNPLTNIAGVYEISDRRISFDTGFNIEAILAMMKKFYEKRKVFRIGAFVILPSWPRHQKWEKRDGVKAGIVAVLESIPKNVLNALPGMGYAFPIPTAGVQPPNNPRSTPQEPRYLDSESDLNSDLNSDIEFDIDGAENNSPPDSASPEPESIFPDEEESPKTKSGKAATTTTTIQRFVKPKLEEISAYCAERRNTVSPEKFLDYYEANGWKVGRNPMKDWRAAVRTWEKNEMRGGRRGSAGNAAGRKDPWDEPGYYSAGGVR